MISYTNPNFTVITNVFPDEFHLHTLDLLLTSIGRLNPNADLKKIIIDLMDRLSNFAVRDSDTNEKLEQRRKVEEQATIKMLEKFKLSKQANPAQSGPSSDNVVSGAPGESEAVNVEDRNASDTVSEDGETEDTSESLIPKDVKLYEVFYGQVANIIQARRLPIHDTMALLVSLVNLSL